MFVYEQTCGTLTRAPHLQTALLPAAIEAAYKLQRWDELEALMHDWDDREHSHNQFSTMSSSAAFDVTTAATATITARKTFLMNLLAIFHMEALSSAAQYIR